jgi:prepilin-type N-terminal cleavage/methylation domain-containing protein
MPITLTDDSLNLLGFKPFEDQMAADAFPNNRCISYMAQTLQNMLAIGDKIKMNKRLKNSGFSFYELMVVIAIIAIISAIAIPNMFAWRASAKFRGAVANLKGDLNMAKLMAVKESAFVVVNFYADNYEIFVDNGAGANTGNWTLDADERRLRNRQLPAGVSIDLAGTDFNNDRTRFIERGLPDNLGKVVVVSSSGDQREIELNRLGRMNVQ